MTVPSQPASAPSAAGRKPTSRPRLHALTGLRLFAALAVYFSHVPTPLGAPGWLVTVQHSGYAGVTFFFILSGFVLTLNYYDSVRTPRELWSYAVARFARVYPLYLVVLAWPTVHLWAAGALPKKDLLLHVFGIQAWSPHLETMYPFVPPAWSISVELFLYATLPVLVPLVRLVDRRVWALVGSVALVLAVLAAVAFLFQSSGRGALPSTDPASAHRWLYRTPLMRTGDFLLGILAARLFLHLREQPVAERLGAWLILPAAGLSVLLAAQPTLLFTAWSWDAMYAVPGTALILGLALAPRHPVGRLLSVRAVVFLGEASFAFYLVHFLLIPLLGSGSWASGVTPQAVVVEAMNLGLTIAVAIGLHVGIEKPGQVLVKRFLDRRPRPSAESGSAHHRHDGHRHDAGHGQLRHDRLPADQHRNRSRAGVVPAAPALDVTSPLTAVPAGWAAPAARPALDGTGALADRRSPPARRPVVPL